MQKYFAAFKNLARFFRRNPEDDRKWTEKLRDKYRLVVMNDETFEEVSSFKLTPLNVYTILSSLIVGTAILVTLLIIYTPLKRYIPGYGDMTRDAEVSALLSKSNELEKEIEATRLYSENMRKLLNNDMTGITKADVEKQGVNAAQKDTNSIGEGLGARIPEDDALRSAVSSGSITGVRPSAEANVAGGIILRDIPLEQLFFMPPVSGETTAKFDPFKDHFGIDIASPRNTAIKAAADGMVVFAGYTVETGYSIAIQHPNNVVTLYKHNSLLLKKAGSGVKAGEAIAIIGNTGESSSGPHLHFELWYKGRPVNPSDYIIFK
jgi:murein DD-endopeptidase MepM/ murein hydrolase activator NlpD